MEIRANENEANNEIMKPITVRFPGEVYDKIRDLSAEFDVSIANVVRWCINDRLVDYLDRVKYVDSEQGEQIRSLVYTLLTECTQIRLELNRIGVNYNQELRLKHANALFEKEGWSINRIISEEKKIKSECKGFNADDVNALISRFENVMKKAGDIICTLL